MAKQPEKTEAERWREIADQYGKEATRLGTAVIELEAEVQQLLAELAAAKAASVCPVELVALGDADWECSVGVKCKSSEDADTLYNWLRDRMKDKPPPEA